MRHLFPEFANSNCVLVNALRSNLSENELVGDLGMPFAITATLKDVAPAVRHLGQIKSGAAHSATIGKTRIELLFRLAQRAL